MSTGLGVLIQRLAGENHYSPECYYGEKIVKAYLKEGINEFCIVFESGTKIRILDKGQSCCEYRYMNTDDDPNCLVGHTLINIQEKDVAPLASTEEEEEDDPYGNVNESTFLEIVSTGGSIVIANYNRHNGYYGGFHMCIDEY